MQVTNAVTLRACGADAMMNKCVAREAFVGDGYGRNVGHGALGLGVTALYDQDIAHVGTKRPPHS